MPAEAWILVASARSSAISAAEAAAKLKELQEDYAVVFITEKLASQMEGELARYRARTHPAVIPIPGQHRTVM